MKTKLKSRITIRISESQKDQVENLASTLGLSPSATLRYLITLAGAQVKSPNNS